jgi:hypothetical protein
VTAPIVTVTAPPTDRTGSASGRSTAVAGPAAPSATHLNPLTNASRVPTAQASTPSATSAVVPPEGSAATPLAAGPWIGFAAILLAAAIVASWNVWLARRRSREEERSRQRTAFAEAFRAYGRYRELPYAIRRRRVDEPAAERVRLSEVAREIQAELTYHQTWMDLEDPVVATAYRSLVAELRKVAGGHMRDAWGRRGVKSDSDMNMVIDMRSLADLETAYVASVQGHLLRLAPWWCR